MGTIISNDWYISLLITGLVALYLIIYVFGFDMDDLKSFLKGKEIGIVVVLLFFLFPLFFIFSVCLLLSAIYSIINLIFLVYENGVGIIGKDVSSGNMSLRVSSIVSVFTTIIFFLKEYEPLKELKTKHEENLKLLGDDDSNQYLVIDEIKDFKTHPINLYSSSVNFAGVSGNLFFNVTILTLWIHLLENYHSPLFSTITLILFFIIDDWALLLHFKLSAEKAVTNFQRLRLFISITAIVILIAISAFLSESILLYISAGLTSILGVLTLIGMAYETLYLDELE